MEVFLSVVASTNIASYALDPPKVLQYLRFEGQARKFFLIAFNSHTLSFPQVESKEYLAETTFANKF